MVVEFQEMTKGEDKSTYQALEQPLPRRGAAGHHVPDLIFELCEFEALLDFVGRHCCLKQGNEGLSARGYFDGESNRWALERGGQKRERRESTSRYILLIGKYQQ